MQSFSRRTRNLLKMSFSFLLRRSRGTDFGSALHKRLESLIVSRKFSANKDCFIQPSSDFDSLFHAPYATSHELSNPDFYFEIQLILPQFTFVTTSSQVHTVISFPADNIRTHIRGFVVVTFEHFPLSLAMMK